MSIQRLLLSLYPRVWRARYEDEFLELLERRPLSISDGIDMLLGAIDAHLHPQLGTSEMPLREKMAYLSRSLRGSLLTGFCAYVGFVLAGCGFQKLNESHEFLAFESISPFVGTSFHLIVMSAVVSLFAVFAGGLPIVITIIKCAFTQKRGSPFLLLAVPFLALGLYIGSILLMTHRGGDRLPWPLGGLIVFGGIVLVAIVSTIAVCVAVVRSSVSGKLLRFAVLPSSIATAAMALVLLATIFWSLGLQHEAPYLLAGNAGIMRSSTMGTLLRIIAMMALSTGLALSSLWRAASLRSLLLRNASS